MGMDPISSMTPMNLSGNDPEHLGTNGSWESLQSGMEVADLVVVPDQDGSRVSSKASSVFGYISRGNSAPAQRQSTNSPNSNSQRQDSSDQGDKATSANAG